MHIFPSTYLKLEKHFIWPQCIYTHFICAYWLSLFGLAGYSSQSFQCLQHGLTVSASVTVRGPERWDTWTCSFMRSMSLSLVGKENPMHWHNYGRISAVSQTRLSYVTQCHIIDRFIHSEAVAVSHISAKQKSHKESHAVHVLATHQIQLASGLNLLPATVKKVHKWIKLYWRNK